MHQCRLTQLSVLTPMFISITRPRNWYRESRGARCTCRASSGRMSGNRGDGHTQIRSGINRRARNSSLLFHHFLLFAVLHLPGICFSCFVLKSGTAEIVPDDVSSRRSGRHAAMRRNTMIFRRRIALRIQRPIFHSMRYTDSRVPILGRT